MSDHETTDIDTDALGALLVKIEQRHERAGWHTDAEFWAYVAYETGSEAAEPIEYLMANMGSPVRTARYSAQPMLSPKLMRAAALSIDAKPTTTFRRWASNVAYADTTQAGEVVREGLEYMRTVLQAPGVVAFAVCNEAFENRDPAKLKALVTGTLGHLGDALSSVEIRVATMLDRKDRVHLVRREAGECGELYIAQAIEGDLVSSMRILVDLAADRLPTGQAGYDDRYPTSEDLARKRGLL